MSMYLNIIRSAVAIQRSCVGICSMKYTHKKNSFVLTLFRCVARFARVGIPNSRPGASRNVGETGARGLPSTLGIFNSKSILLIVIL